MPSKMHQMLVDLIGRKMYDRGYIPVAFDGKKYVANGEKVPIPLKIGRHRPDIIGINIKTKILCIGEAKTASDLSSERTREQLSDYANIIGFTSGQKFELIIGIPTRAESALLKLMSSLSLNGLSNVSYILLPEELVETDQETFI
jgi:hypothetical protein